jgi:Ca2+/Na+ antiporter
LTELRELVVKEIDGEREQYRRFDRYVRPPWLIIVFLLALFLVNLPIFLMYENYLPIWIISSFALIMVVWFLVLLPTSEKEAEEKKRREEQENEEKKKGGIGGLKENKKTLFNVLWNIFFTNCQPLAPGIVILQLINIFMVVYG